MVPALMVCAVYSQQRFDEDEEHAKLLNDTIFDAIFDTIFSWRHFIGDSVRTAAGMGSAGAGSSQTRSGSNQATCSPTRRSLPQRHDI